MADNGTRLALVAAVSRTAPGRLRRIGRRVDGRHDDGAERGRAGREGGPQPATRLLPHRVPGVRRDGAADAGREGAHGDERPASATIAFVPKELALKRFAQTKPELARRMHTNLFPDAFEVVPRSRIDVYPLILDFAKGVDGVVNVRVSRPCGQT